MSELAEVLPVARELLRALDPARPVRLLGVRVAGMEGRPIVPLEADQLDLGV
ncbi:MAG: hypothetical protein WKF40_02835 [Thermoleophilaceae bacterium]